MERIAVPAGQRSSIRRPKRLLALRSDDRLVELVRAGDDNAFEVLYERHAAGILGFCRHMLSSQHEAEDAVQQAFVSAHRDMLRSAHEINFKPWLYTIARNRCLSMLRARREQATDPPEPTTAGLQESVERRDDLRELVADVQRLPDDQREALVLSELGDLSHTEVAEVLGVETVAVKGLVFRARSSLMERRDARLADCGEIREELSVVTGGGLRRSRLRYHLEGCPGCRAYLDEVRRQRKLLGVALPVVPTLALQENVMAAVGVGAGSVGAAGAIGVGGAATAGTSLFGGAGASVLGGTLAKVAVVGVLAAGTAGVATEVVRDGGGSEQTTGEQSIDGRSGATGSGADGTPARRSEERSHGRRGAERRERGQQISQERSGGRSAAGELKEKAVGRSDGLPAPNGGPPTELPTDRAGDNAPSSPPRVTPPEPPRGDAPVTPAPPPPASPKAPGAGGTSPSSPPVQAPVQPRELRPEVPAGS